MAKYILAFSLLFFSVFASAQEFNITGEVRPRFENRNGYGSPREPYQSADNSVSQRTRLTFGFAIEKFEIGIAIQDVRVWGDISTTPTSDPGVSFQLAWARYHINEKWSTKFGRQVIAYDDERIMGALNWAQTGRSHDALVIEWRPNSNQKLDLGFAYNNDNVSNFDTLYSNIAGYKTFQYGWYHGDFNKFSLSFLLLNTGIQYQTGTTIADYELKLDYYQTFGPYMSYNSGPVSAEFSTYLQTGKYSGATKLASFVGGNINYKWKSGFSVGVAGQYLSGKGQSDTSPENKSFNPLFGTNHKFNGWMDYFYVGNFNNSVGLIDLNMPFSYTYKKFTARLIPHYFQADGNVLNSMGENMDKYLGTEIDGMVSYTIDKNVNIQVGYSQMFATKTMTALKGGTTIDNHWAWVMITVNPILFKTKPKKGAEN